MAALTGVRVIDLTRLLPGAFATLMLLGRGGWPTRLGMVALGLLGYGILIELCQHAFTANRVGELRDVIADSLGIALGWLLARPWRVAPA